MAARIGDGLAAGAADYRAPPLPKGALSDRGRIASDMARGLVRIRVVSDDLAAMYARTRRLAAPVLPHNAVGPDHVA